MKTLTKTPTHTPQPDGVLTLSENAQDVYVPGIKGDDGTGAWLSRFDIVRAVNSHDGLITALKAQMSWRMRDGSLCGCRAGRNEDEAKGKMPLVHSTSCEMARQAIARAEKGE